MAEEWLVLSDRAPDAAAPPAMVDAGLFVVELALPLAEAAVLLDFHSAEGWPRTFTLFHDPQAGLVLIHRQGQQVARHALPGPVAQAQGTGRLSLRFDAPGRVWQMRLDYLGQDSMTPAVAEGRDPLPLLPGDLYALSEGPFRSNRHSAVLWFGLTKGAALPQRAPWIGQRTPIDTPRGPVMAGHLSPGDLVCTADGGLLPLRGITRLDLPARGSFAPVILRAPFFGCSHDILVASDQLVALSGLEVEYLFDEEEVLIQAGDLVDGRSALAEQRRAVASVLLLEFDFPALLVADGCTLLAGQHRQPAPRRVLRGYETLTLMALLGRAGHRRVA
jgi:Hint domain